jgi:SpoIID/LytB domain protein
VEVATISEPRQARKTADDLKKKFSEPLQTVYDYGAGSYRILIGRFNARAEAEEMTGRLRLAGYRAARVIAEEEAKNNRPDETVAADSTADTNARIAKRQVQPQHKQSGAGSNSAEPQRAMQIIAFDRDRMIALSDEWLIVSAADSPDDSVATRRTVSSDKANPSDTDANSPRLRTVGVGGKDYRGEIHLVLNSRGRINVVNALPMEEYLRGVVPLELPPASFPAIEALKAQAVAARTYAIAHRGQFNSEGYDLRDDARSQVYGGVAAEREMTNRAVEATRGVIAVYFDRDGKAVPVDALYTSTCGGRTEDNESAFGTAPVPYLRSVACSPDRQTVSGREIVSSRVAEPLISAEGRAITREVALVEAMGFSLPRRVTNNYLSGAASQDEVSSWIEAAARAAKETRPQAARGDLTRLAAFVQAVSSAVYGQGRAALIVSPGGVD